MQLVLHSIESKKVHGLLATLPIRTTHKQYILPASIAIQKSLKSVVVVENRETAMTVIDQFRKKQSGVVTCMILSELTNSTQEIPSLPNVRPLIEVIACPKEYESLTQKLFGKWLLAENDDAAIAVERSTRNWNCITMDGVMYLANGEVRQWEDKYQLLINTIIRGLYKLQSAELEQFDEKKVEQEKQSLERKLKELKNQVGDVDYTLEEEYVC